MLDLIDSKQFAEFLQLTPNHLYCLVRKAVHDQDKDSIFFPALVVGRRNFFDTGRVLDKMES